MPELPEVHTIVHGLVGPLTGEEIVAAELTRADVLRGGPANLVSRLIGRRIERIHREGKWIIFSIVPGARLVIHLGMSGRLTLDDPGSPRAAHTHAIFRFGRCPLELRFRDPRRFGGIWFHQAGEEALEGLGELGPDALSIRVPVLRGILASRRQIKALLLDQRMISGLGNIYCDESLFRSRIHPLTPASRLNEAQVRRLACAIRKSLRASIESGGSTLMDYRQPDGSEGLFQKSALVYGREGEPCKRCGRAIRRIMVAGRSSHVCPSCQRPPRSMTHANGRRDTSPKR